MEIPMDLKKEILDISEDNNIDLENAFKVILRLGVYMYKKEEVIINNDGEFTIYT